MLLPKTSSEKASVSATFTNTVGIVRQMKTVRSLGQHQNLSLNTMQQWGNPTKVTVLFLAPPLSMHLHCFDNVCQNNLSRFVLSSSEETWQKYSVAASGKSEQEVAFKRNMCQSVCGCTHTALLPLLVSYRPCGTTTKKSHVKCKVLPQKGREWHAKMIDPTSITHYREQWCCQNQSLGCRNSISTCSDMSQPQSTPWIWNGLAIPSAHMDKIL